MATIVRRGGADARRTVLGAELERLVERLRGLEGVHEVWAFGSTVSGDVHATSDLDLLVVRETTETPSRRIEILLTELAPTVPVDVFVYTPEELAAGGRFVDDVRRRGRRLL